MTYVKAVKNIKLFLKKEKRVLYLEFLHEIDVSLNISVKRVNSIQTTMYFKYQYNLLHCAKRKWRKIKRTFYIHTKKSF